MTIVVSALGGFAVIVGAFLIYDVHRIWQLRFGFLQLYKTRSVSSSLKRLTLVAFAAVLLLFPVNLLCKFAMIVCGITAAAVFNEWRKQRSTKLYINELMQSLNQLTQALRAGCGIVEALQGIVVKGKASTGLAGIAAAFQAGHTLEEAILIWRKQERNPVVLAASDGLLVTLRSGGSQVLAIESALQTARAWHGALEMRHTQSAQVRASALLLSLLPICMLVFMMIASPDTRELFLYSTVGSGLLLIGVLLNAAGTFSVMYLIRQGL